MGLVTYQFWKGLVIHVPVNTIFTSNCPMMDPPTSQSLMTNRVNPNQEWSDQGLHCLCRPFG